MGNVQFRIHWVLYIPSGSGDITLVRQSYPGEAQIAVLFCCLSPPDTVSFENTEKKNLKFMMPEKVS